MLIDFGFVSFVFRCFLNIVNYYIIKSDSYFSDIVAWCLYRRRGQYFGDFVSFVCRRVLLLYMPMHRPDYVDFVFVGSSPQWHQYKWEYFSYFVWFVCREVWNIVWLRIVRFSLDGVSTQGYELRVFRWLRIVRLSSSVASIHAYTWAWLVWLRFRRIVSSKATVQVIVFLGFRIVRLSSGIVCIHAYASVWLASYRSFFRWLLLHKEKFLE